MERRDDEKAVPTRNARNREDDDDAGDRRSAAVPP